MLRDHPEVAVLPLIVVGAFLLRYLTLLQVAYPPSGDAAGDLVWLQTYLGHPLPGYGLVEAPPPVYIFLVVLPATQWLGIFAGIQFNMAAIPALTAVPTYFLLRELDCGKVAALGGAAVMATSADFSAMVAWNSAFNATGILFLLGFLALMLHGLRRPSTGTIVAAGLLFALVAGTHVVTFFYALAAIGAFGIELLLLERRRARAPLVFLVESVVVGAVFLIPFAPNYYDDFLVTANVGPPSGSSGILELLFSYSQAFTLPWGSNVPVSTPDLLGAIVLLDVLLTMGALFWLWRRPECALAARFTSALFFAAIFLAVLDPGNAIRAIYFLPLSYVPAVAVLASRWGTRPAGTPRPAARVLPSRPRWRLDPAPRRSELVVLGGAFVVANAIVSQQTLLQAEQFYLLLSPTKLATLNWISEHTPGDAVFYDGADLQTWLPGYAHRLSYAPDPLNSRITSISYSRALDANLIDLGGYVAGDAQLYVTSNAPGVYNTPGILLRTSDFSMPIWLGEADETWVTVQSPSGPARVLLSYGQGVNVTGGVLANGTAEMTTQLLFPSEGLTLFETLAVAGNTVSVGFSSPNGTVTSVNMYLRTPPSGYYYDYPSFPSGSTTGALRQSLAVPDFGTVGVVSTGPNFVAVTQTESTGWSSLNLTVTDGWSLTISGWTGGGTGPGFFDATFPLAQELGIGYFVVSEASDYPLFERLFALATQGYLDLPIVFLAGSIAVFQLS